MATRFSSALIPDNSTDAHFQAWAQFIEDTLVTTGGWVVTGDTGQTLPASLAHPTTTITKKGYRVYRMADSLQATSPVFMRVDYGSGGATANIPSIWTTIGTGSDGAGNITGVLWNGGASSSPTTGCITSSTTQVCNSYGSAGTSRACFTLFVQAITIQYFLVFGIERTKNSSGADTGDGLLLVYGPASAGTNDNLLARSRYLRCSGGTQPTEEVGLSYVLSNNNPSEIFSPGDVGLGIVIHFCGAPQQPGTQWMLCNSSDVSNEGVITATLYGAARTYQHLNLITPSKASVGTSFNDPSARCLMRYD